MALEFHGATCNIGVAMNSNSQLRVACGTKNLTAPSEAEPNQFPADVVLTWFSPGPYIIVTSQLDSGAT